MPRLLLLAFCLLAGCDLLAPQPADLPFEDGELIEEGIASWYGDEYAGRPTASGEVFDPAAMTAAHRTLPFGTRVRVHDPATDRAVTVRINDRGPFVDGRIIDLSAAAADALGFRAAGLATVRLHYVAP